MEAEGIRGELRAGARVAARLGAWRMYSNGEGHRVQARFEWTDRFWITQSPLSLELEIGPVRWTWRNVELLSNEIQVQGAPKEGLVQLV